MIEYAQITQSYEAIFVKLSDIQNSLQNRTAEGAQLPKTNLGDRFRELALLDDCFYQDLEMGGRYVDAYRDVSSRPLRISLHTHEFYELILFQSCPPMEYLVGAERFQVRPGDLLVIPPEVSHCPLLPEDLPQPYIRDVIWFRPDFLRDTACAFNLPPQALTPELLLLRTSGTRWEYLSSIVRLCVAEAERQANCAEVALVGATWTLLAHLSRARSEDQRAARFLQEPELVDRILAYLDTHLSEKITLEDVARQHFVSKSTVVQHFSKKVGLSFYRYVTLRRLLTAKSLIHQGFSLEEAAAQSGFSDYSAFFRAFKKEFHISPKQYLSHLTSASHPIHSPPGQPVPSADSP